MVCPYGKTDCKNHDLWNTEYGSTPQWKDKCCQWIWDFCSDDEEPEMYVPIGVDIER